MGFSEYHFRIRHHHVARASSVRAEGTTQLTNPVSQHCIDLGGTVEIHDTPAGQIGVCHVNETKCEEWALFCGEGCVVPDSVEVNETTEGCVACPTEKPTEPVACTMEYAPVCAQKDNGIRCIKASCPSTENVT